MYTYVSCVCVLAVFEFRDVFSMTYTTDRQTERLNESVNGGLVEYVGYEEKQTEAYTA